ncbi:hypothetical protein VKT23_003402 [Stygiomarasmius scandens]|uniref:Uncharacterized protein n=1 Tax=Marasmiellus scandens TaxID=2682957 RepID=A0ABR1K041_9AGAR
MSANTDKLDFLLDTLKPSSKIPMFDKGEKNEISYPLDSIGRPYTPSQVGRLVCDGTLDIFCLHGLRPIVHTFKENGKEWGGATFAWCAAKLEKCSYLVCFDIILREYLEEKDIEAYLITSSDGPGPEDDTEEGHSLRVLNSAEHQQYVALFDDIPGVFVQTSGALTYIPGGSEQSDNY